MPGTSGRVTKARLQRLSGWFGGDVITAGSKGYDDARRVWNAMYDRRPALVLRPAGAADVATAIRFGREHDLAIAIKSGAHSAAGHSSIDDGLVIDLSLMRGVTVDPIARTARVNGGALLGEMDIAAQAYGLVCPVGVIGHTGVAGLTLGGGIGRLQRHYGLTIDSLRAVELVTADGRTVRATEADEPDLFWGLRGAGPNFGVATAFEFDLHPFGPLLHRGLAIYRGSQVRDVWAMVDEYGRAAPEAVALIMAIARAEPAEEYPPSVAGEPIVLVAYNHSGDAAAVEADTAPLRAGPEPVSLTSGSQPYLEVQTANDLAMGWGHRSWILGSYADDLRPDVLDALVDHVADAPTGASISASLQGSAMARFA
ncbi:MAG: FAD-binding oxidoreductase, partial [Chloroflexota bacterium]